MLGVGQRVKTVVNGDDSMNFVTVRKRRISVETERTELDHENLHEDPPKKTHQKSYCRLSFPDIEEENEPLIAADVNMISWAGVCTLCY